MLGDLCAPPDLPEQHPRCAPGPADLRIKLCHLSHQIKKERCFITWTLGLTSAASAPTLAPSAATIAPGLYSHYGSISLPTHHLLLSEIKLSHLFQFDETSFFHVFTQGG